MNRRWGFQKIRNSVTKRVTETIANSKYIKVRIKITKKKTKVEFKRSLWIEILLLLLLLLLLIIIIIDSKKAYDMVSQSWIVYSLKMYKILDEVIKFIKKPMENRGVELPAREKSFAEVRDPKRHIPGRCTLIITICNSDDGNPSHSQEMHSRIQTQEIVRKDKPFNVHRRHQTVY